MAQQSVATPLRRALALTSGLLLTLLIVALPSRLTAILVDIKLSNISRDRTSQ
jgi:hypothetical protein